MKINVLLADDHQIVLNGVKELLSKESDMAVIAMARNGHEALELARQHRPHVAVLDITMEGLNGIEVARILHKEYPDMGLLGLSMHNNRRMIAEFLTTGARGYVLKESDLRELLRAIRALGEGEYYLSPKATSIVVQDYCKLLGKARPTPGGDLSPRETEVLQLLVQGFGTKEIGQKLHISKNTVDTHRRNVMDKLNCHNLVELTRLAIQENMVDMN